ncbi:hypothetical protein EF847_20310 [Actinobacteria bacterium YIM 96077]|uniref:MHYT domain-containing protein n=2 Tax=Phytoactinopolyspora halophila TaxID=1981511 RepID=A0A329QGU1_9ACTN|nr:hypothetical protein EF847_20310 [Actinobacteria bacterium YIM 96077]RAW11653.1 hypothetical protein DPM12_16140 [Phytoactinopolyspora halophila]
MACVGAGLGLRCMVRAAEVTGAAKYSWLATSAVAVGSGIWIMHLIVILGFGLEGSPVRYDVPLTLLSLLAAILLVGVGLFAVGYSTSFVRGLLIGGVACGLGIAAMHYIGMAGMRFHGTMSHDATLVGVSIGIAIGAATLALWLSLHVRGFRGTVIAALVMGAAATVTEYTGIVAIQVAIVPGTSVLPGASAVEFLFPFIVIFGSFLFLSSAFVALSPFRHERDAAAPTSATRGRDSHLVS